MSKFAPRACGPVAGPVCQATEIGQAIVPHDASALPFRSEMSLYLGFCRPRAAHRGPMAGPAVLTVKSGPVAGPPVRSEEHTSELQSRENLVCRLLLEQKKRSPHGGDA